MKRNEDERLNTLPGYIKHTVTEHQLHHCTVLNTGILCICVYYYIALSHRCLLRRTPPQASFSLALDRVDSLVYFQMMKDIREIYIHDKHIRVASSISRC